MKLHPLSGRVCTFTYVKWGVAEVFVVHQKAVMFHCSKLFRFFYDPVKVNVQRPRIIIQRVLNYIANPVFQHSWEAGGTSYRVLSLIKYQMVSWGRIPVLMALV